MILERGNMWDVFGNTDLFLITTNPIRRKDGALVMGRGIALEAAKRFPDLPFKFGEAVEQNYNRRDYCDPLAHCHCMSVDRFDGQMMGYFMVKNHWREPAKLEVIAHSTRELNAVARYVGDGKRFDLNFPGIGNGRLDRATVLPLLESLPDNVHIWEY